MICGSAGSKSHLGKAAGAEVAVWRTNEKLHAAVARSIFASQNVPKLRGTERCRKIARRCGEKHIFKSKCKKSDGFGPLV